MTESNTLTQIELVTCQVGDAHIAFLSHHVLAAKQLSDETRHNCPRLESRLNLPLTSDSSLYQLQLSAAHAQTQPLVISSEMALIQLPFPNVFALPTLLKQRQQLPGLIALAYDPKQQHMLSIIDPTLWKA